MPSAFRSFGGSGGSAGDGSGKERGPARTKRSSPRPSSVLSPQPVTDAPHGPDIHRVGGIRLDLGAEAPDVHHHRIFVGGEGFPQTDSKIWALVKTLPGWERNSLRISNSFAVSATRRSPT